MRLRYLAVPLLLLAAGCGGQPAGAGPGPTIEDPLRGQTFLATEVTVDGQPHALVAGTEVSVEFADDGRLIAQAGCNNMQGQVDTADGKLAFDGGLSTTDMGCDPPRHAQDEFVAGVLGASPTWRLDGSRLEITAGTTSMVLTERSVVEPDKDLVGPKWTLDTLVDGQTASSTTAGAEPVTLVFDGTTAVADTHCNGVTATYTVEGDTIVLTQGPSTKMACPPDIMRVENALAEVLQGSVTFEITADRLTLQHPSGKGIQLSAK
jgi:heat shock protein HslJ